MLYFYLKNLHNEGNLPNHLVLVADNCGGQNKNNYMFQFLHFVVWELKWIDKISLFFMITGHTKFSLDRNFGTFENYIK
jgi:hypothetical protein